VAVSARGYPGGRVLASFDRPKRFRSRGSESIEPLAAIRMEWDDVFEIDVFPVVTAEEGLERLRRTMSSEQG